jgi:predicted lipoprotein with Yx(FWY)xxD motif
MAPRTVWRTAAISAFIGTLVLATSGARAAGSHQTAATTVKEASNALGTILTDNNGMTLYILSSEVGGTIKCSGGCLTIWPPLTVPSGTTPSGPADLTGKFATITRPDGSLQVTYQGFPLYHFIRDKAPGDTNGNHIIAFEGEWFAARPDVAPLSATPVGSGTVRIAARAAKPLGTVTLWYRQRAARVSSTCSSPSCAMVAPLGHLVHLTQRPAKGYRFTGWLVTRPGSTNFRTARSSVSFHMVNGARVTAGYAR